MTITPSTDPIVSISIELLPEFGFTVQDEPVYGPGSVFQGTLTLTGLCNMSTNMYIRHRSPQNEGIACCRRSNCADV